MLPRTFDQAAPARDTRPSALTPQQLATVSAIGVILWFAAAKTVFFGSAAGFFGPTASLLTFIIAIPICWLSVWVSKKLARLAPGQTLPGIAIGLVAATLCDGIALTWGQRLYGSDPAQVTFGAAWILWGVAFFLLFGYRADYHRSTN